MITAIVCFVLGAVAAHVCHRPDHLRAAYERVVSLIRRK